jgi:hypothetical protein
MDSASSMGLEVAPQVKQRVFHGAETLANVLILNGLLKLALKFRAPHNRKSRPHWEPSIHWHENLDVQELVARQMLAAS